MQKLLLLSLLVFNIYPVFSQTTNLQQPTSINADGAAPDASAILHVQSTDKGMLVPRMTSAQRTGIATPATALLVFDTDTGSFWFYTGTAWQNLNNGGSPFTFIQDTDGDTKVQTEESSNEDKIRFNIGGVQKLMLVTNPSGTPRLEFSSPDASTFIGSGAGQANSGSQNVGLGGGAMAFNTTGYSNTAVGTNAMLFNTTGNSNTAIGFEALFNNTTGPNNTAIGQRALYANLDGYSNVAVGGNSLLGNTTGHANIAVGWSALAANSTGFDNTALGNFALTSNTSANGNTAVGSGSLNSNTTGSYNTVLGHSAMSANIDGNFNTTVGSYSLSANVSGMNNTGLGVNALFYNTTGSNNTAVGTGAMDANIDGGQNTAIGVAAMNALTQGYENTAVGYFAGPSVNNLSNTSALGQSAFVNTSNKVRIGAANVTVIEGQVDWTFPSDARFKFNVKDDAVPGLAFITQLRPVTYQFDTRKFDEHLMQNMPDSVQQRRLAGQDYAKSSATVQTGFLAQEVEEACKKIGYSFSGLHVPESGVDNYGLAYGSFVPLLVKSIQEQQSMIAQQAVLIGQQQEQLAKQAAQLATIWQKLEAAGVFLRD